MIWRHSTDQMKQFDGGSHLQLRFTKKEIQKALSDQYRSTYRSDFLGLPQGKFYELLYRHLLNVFMH